MNDYQQEQWDALGQIVEKIGSIASIHDGEDCRAIRSYIRYRKQLDAFLTRHFGRFCTQTCFADRTSACCSKDGIITFWADAVVNVCHSTKDQIDDLFAAIQEPLWPHKCIYLGENGCRWQVRPVGCALFLCDAVQADVLEPHPELSSQWNSFTEAAKRFRWPDRPVLFDRLEQVFMSVGCRSTLMYINTSPGLLHIKRKAGLP